MKASMTLDRIQNPEIPSDAESISLAEREKRLTDALHTIQSLASLVGHEDLPIVEATGADGILTSPGIYWLDTTRDTQQVEDTSFVFLPEHLSGAADSAHAVVPGKLVVTKTDGSESDITVVAKCYSKREFPDRIARAIKEVRVMNALRERGKLTITPVAVAVAPWSDENHGEVILITHYNPQLVTFDNLPWSLGLTPENIENAELGASAVAQFISFGYRHGDAKIKNVAQDEDSNVAMIDFETSEEIDMSNPQDVSTAVLEDYGKYLDSLKKKGLFGNRKRRLSATFIRNAIDSISLAFASQWEGASEETQNLVWEQMEQAIHVNFPNIENHRGYYAA